MAANGVFIALLALALEAAFGSPHWLHRCCGHPVEWMGRLIGWCEARLNRPQYSVYARRMAGATVTFTLLTGVIATALFIRSALQLWLDPVSATLAESALSATLVAQRQLGQAVASVATSLDQGPEAARRAVSHIVGRDPNSLNESGIIRAALESLAENASDAVIAPLFYAALFGLPGIVAYKFINTADSMIGYRNERHEDFGKTAARLDDAVNLLPARLTGLLIAAAAWRNSGSLTRCLAIMRRDAGKHRSPNAGWPEAALAAGLGIRLGGPRSYDGAAVSVPWLGEGRETLLRSDIDRALRLYRRAMMITGALLAGTGALILLNL